LSILALHTSDFPTEISSGNDANHSVINKFGLNEALTNGVGEDIWDLGGNFVPATIADQCLINSTAGAADSGTVLSSGIATNGNSTTLLDSSADFTGDGVVVGDFLVNDSEVSHGVITRVTSNELEVSPRMAIGPRNLAGKEIRAGHSYRVVTPGGSSGSMILVQGLNQNWEAVSEYVVLDGLNDVQTVNSYLRIHRMVLVQAGALTTNAGVIVARNVASGSISMAAINTTRSQTLMAIFTIPKDHVGIMTHYYASLANNQSGDADVVLWSQPFGEPLQIKNYQTLKGDGTSTLNTHPKFGMAFAERTLIKVRVIAGAVNMAAAAGFDILLYRVR
jgi:hypothetical protein